MKLPHTTRILLVNGAPDMVSRVQEILAAAGYPTEGTGSALEAIAWIRRDPPDLLLLDAAGPAGMEDLELCRQLKTDEPTAAVPILVVTARDDFRDKAEVLAAGADDYVTRPLDPTDLLTRVRGLVQLGHLRQELARTLAYLYGLQAGPHQGDPATVGGASGPGRRGREAGPHILVVDAHRIDRELQQRLLEGAGYRVTAVAAVTETYRPVGRGVDVILLNFRIFPEMSGLLALERMHQLAPDVPIVIVSAYKDLPTAFNALPVEALNIIADETKHEMLLNSVARAVERRRLFWENRRLMEALRARLEGAATQREIRAGYAVAAGTRPARTPWGGPSGAEQESGGVG